ncbi:MAG: InlB B-repeat-containing protein [Anaerovoracaceae bacterium]
MATVKKSKKRIIVPIAIVLVIAIIVTSIVIVRKVNGGEQVTLHTISTGDIYETVSATGDVTAGASRTYKVGTVATVKEVFVQKGDKVKEGDKLATFDTSNVDAQISKLQGTYTDAKKAYNTARSNQTAAKSNLAAVNKQINTLEKQIAKLQKRANTTTSKKKTTTKKHRTTLPTTVPTTRVTTTKATTAKAATYTVKATVLAGQESYGTVQVGNNTAGSTSAGKYDEGADVVIKAVPVKDYSFSGWYDANGTKLKSSKQVTVQVRGNVQYIAQFEKTSTTGALADLSDTLAEIADNIRDMTNDVDTMMQIMKTTADAISKALDRNITDSNAIANAVEKAIRDAISDGLINEDNLKVMGDVLAKSIAQAVKKIDWKSVAKDLTSTTDIQLTTKQLQLAALYAQSKMYAVEASDTAVSAQKSVMEGAESALTALQDANKDLQAGWTASFDGTITTCDLVAGEQTSLVNDGIVLENMNTMVVTISLSEYDNHRVKVGMPCTITTAYGKYEGEVTAKAPTATGGSTGSILDNVGSMAGISGLSSLTSSGAGVECTVEVKHPDENIIIGFEANVVISTGEYLGVVTVPTGSIVLDKTGTYVYLYNEKEKTVTKTAITTGAMSDSAYQVTDGLKAGDKIVAAPSTTYKEDSFKVKVVDKLSTTK